MTTGNPAQQQRLPTLRRLLAEREALNESRIELRRAQGLEAVQQLAPKGQGRRLQEQLRGEIAQAKRVESDLLKGREAGIQRGTLVTQAVIIGGGLLAFGLVALSMFLIRRDLSARRVAEQQLDRFFSLSLDFLCILDVDGYFKRVSAAVTDILGWSVEEFLSRPAADFVHPDDLAASRREARIQIAAGEKVCRFENRYRHKDGSWRTLSWHSVPLPDGMMYAIARDVSEIKRKDEALRQSKDDLEIRVNERTAELARVNESLLRSERRSRAMIEHGGDAIMLSGEDGKTLYVSPAVVAVEGYTPEEMLDNADRPVHPDDRPLVEQIREQLRTQPGQPVPVTWRRKHKLGHWMWLEGVATNLLHDPAVRAVVSNYRNVTERKEAEQRRHAQLARLALLSHITRAIGERQDSRSIFQVVVRSLEEQLPVDFACLCLYRPESGNLTVTNVGASNRALAKDLALTEQATIEIDQNGLSHCVRGELVYEPDLGAVSAPFPQRLLRGGLRAFVAAPLLTENKVFGVLIAARVEANSFSSGECEFLRQLSEHVALAAHHSQLYESLQSAYEELRQTQQAVMQQERLRVLGQMASGIAHDINNAISPISLYTESLLEHEPTLTVQGRGFLETIRRAIGDVAETVGRMREFYRQRETEIPLSPLQLNALGPQVVELTRARWSDMPQLRGSVIEMKTEFAAGLPSVMGVESEIREALTNLVFNAADAMPQGGTLTLRTSLCTAGDGAERVLLEVIDTGVGMSEDTRRRCLELFFTTKGERGTGLGLAMVYGIVQRHNAEIDIHSSPGNGTRVTLSFAAARETAPAHVVELPAAPAGLRILVVGDDHIILESMQIVLENDGCIVVTAAGGSLGIEAFAASLREGPPFDIVITDLGMPAVDGREVARTIKALSAATPIIMLTGWGQRMVSDGDTPEHVDKVMSKPPKPRDLRTAIAEFATRKLTPAGTADSGSPLKG